MPKKSSKLLLKLAGLFSVVRGYNILMIILAQYLASIFIIAPNYLSTKEILLDVNLFLLILSSSLVIASGYIINNFYDSEKDLINRPLKTHIDNLVSSQTKLSFYFILNFLAVIIASYVSFNSVIFFSIYIFTIWLYSHRLKKYAFIGNFAAALLAVTPFFVIFIYYINFDLVIFVHALFLFTIVSMRELVKDLENLRGDFAQNYQTIPVKYGPKLSKKLLTFSSLLSLIPVYILLNFFEVGYMKYYFILSLLLLFIFTISVWYAKKKVHYLLLHNLLKFIIVFGVFCILLIDLDVFIKRIL